jgi:hypothetical protein
VDDPRVQTVGQCLTECGARLAPYERRRVGRAGCIASIAAMAAALAAIAVGWWSVDGSWAAGFRFVVLSGLAAALALFVAYAALEGFAVRGVRARLTLFLRESGEDIDTLIGAAAMRRDQIPGMRVILTILNEIKKTESKKT